MLQNICTCTGLTDFLKSRYSLKISEVNSSQLTEKPVWYLTHWKWNPIFSWAPCVQPVVSWSLGKQARGLYRRWGGHPSCRPGASPGPAWRRRPSPRRWGRSWRGSWPSAWCGTGGGWPACPATSDRLAQEGWIGWYDITKPINGTSPPLKVQHRPWAGLGLLGVGRRKNLGIYPHVSQRLDSMCSVLPQCPQIDRPPQVSTNGPNIPSDHKLTYHPKCWRMDQSPAACPVTC